MSIKAGATPGNGPPPHLGNHVVSMSTHMLNSCNAPSVHTPSNQASNQNKVGIHESGNQFLASAQAATAEVRHVQCEIELHTRCIMHGSKDVPRHLLFIPSCNRMQSNALRLLSDSKAIAVQWSQHTSAATIQNLKLHCCRSCFVCSRYTNCVDRITLWATAA